MYLPPTPDVTLSALTLLDQQTEAYDFKLNLILLDCLIHSSPNKHEFQQNKAELNYTGLV